MKGEGTARISLLRMRSYSMHIKQKEHDLFWPAPFTFKNKTTYAGGESYAAICGASSYSSACDAS